MFAGLRPSPSSAGNGGGHSATHAAQHSSASFAHRGQITISPTPPPAAAGAAAMDEDASHTVSASAGHSSMGAASRGTGGSSFGASAGGGWASRGPSPFARATAPAASGSSRASVSDLRIQKDLHEISFSKFHADSHTRISFPDGVTNLRRFHVLVTPTTGLYARSSFLFAVFIPQQYPFAAPRVQCRTPCLHPSINWRTGQVYLHLLKSEWKPVLSINTVIFSLQLLFLEPWPVGSALSATSSTMPPTRPMLSSAASAASASTSSASSATLPSALTLASSKSATASAARQFDEGSILNLEVYKFIEGGERGVFEDMVRRTLEGGFFFGSHWPRNKNDDDDDSASDSDEEDTPAVPFETLLKKVEMNGRKAHLSPQPNHRASHRHSTTTTTDDNMMHETENDEMADSHDHAARPSILITPHSPQARTAGHFRPAKHHTGSGSSSSRPMRSPILHRKRCFSKTSPAREHASNPAAALSPSRGEDYDFPQTKRVRALPMDDVDNPTLAAALRCATSNSSRVIKLRSLDGASASSHLLSVPNHDPSRPAGARILRKRPSPTPAHQLSVGCGSGSFSDGEYEDEAESQLHPLTEAKDDGSSAPRRRMKKHKPSFDGGLHSLDEDDGMHPFSPLLGSDLLPATNPRHHPRASSTVLPDLATFASFRPVSTINIEAIARRSQTPQISPPTAATTACVSDPSQSPKRNVSDCRAVHDIGAQEELSLARADSSSFILHGRSSSRSINLFGTAKQAPVNSGAGLASLQGILASLPRTSSNLMAD